MTIARDQLKAEILQRLSEVAVEHPVGHQGKLAARYILRSAGGECIELMFEKGPASASNLWMHRRYAEALLIGGIEYRESSADGLFALQNEKGKKLYGRHAALLAMPQLANADLVCFKLKAFMEIEKVLIVLLRA